MEIVLLAIIAFVMLLFGKETAPVTDNPPFADTVPDAASVVVVVAARAVVPVTANAFEPMVAPPRAMLVAVAVLNDGVPVNAGEASGA